MNTEYLEDRMGGMGGLMMAVGFLVMLGAVFAFDVSVPTGTSLLGQSSVANMDLVAIRGLLFSGGGFILVAGSVLFASARVRKAIYRAYLARFPLDDVEQ